MNRDFPKAVISTEPHYCEGCFANTGGAYLLGVNFGLSAVKKAYGHQGSDNLDRINAFDKAEVSHAHMGQINMMQVSSFCGPKGRIWGLDICPVAKQQSPLELAGGDLIDLPQFHEMADGLKLWSIHPLVDAFSRLTGTVDQPRFPFMPGSHVPCAVKSIIAPGPQTLYAAQAIGVPADRERHACLIMEDYGRVPVQGDSQQVILISLLRSLLAVGRNQRVCYREVFLGLKTLPVAEDEMGCAMVANPYFLLAGNAVPSGGKSIAEIGLDEWERTVLQAK